MDAVTQGRWKGVHGGLCVSLYPDGGTQNCPTMFIRGGGTILASGQAQGFGGELTFDVRAPRRYTLNNSTTGLPWPADAGFGAGLYNRTADGVPFRLGMTITSPSRVWLYLVDMNAGVFTSSRAEKIDVYTQTTQTQVEPGSLGQPYANGPLLTSVTVQHFEQGVYVGFDVTGPVNFQFTAIEPSHYADGRLITDTNGLAILNGVFIDAIPRPSPPTGLRIVR